MYRSIGLSGIETSKTVHDFRNIYPANFYIH